MRRIKIYVCEHGIMDFYIGKEVNFWRISCETLNLKHDAFLIFYIFYDICQESSKGFIGRIGIYIGFIG